MPRTLIARALLAAPLFVAPLLVAQDERSATVEPFATIEKEFDDAQKKWMSSYREASKQGASEHELAQLAANRPGPEPFVDRVAGVLEATPAAGDGAAAAIWLIGAGRVQGAQLGRALEVLEQHHCDSESLKKVMLSLSRTPAPAVSAFLEKVRTVSDSIDNRALACYSLAEQLMAQAGLIRSFESASDAELRRSEERYGSAAIDAMQRADVAKVEERSAARYEEVIGNEEYAAIPRFGSTLGAQAQSALFELRKLSVGKLAPDIIGEDIDGTPMKLSDYRGKVVVLDFWGDW